MLKEFAVDPRVIASSFETCRYLFSQFGADKGRLISRFPKTWKKMAIDAADKLPDGYNKERVIEYLTDINNEWLTLIGSGRNCQNPDNWLESAITAHESQPFQAILCDYDNPNNQLIDGYRCNENHPLFAAPRIQKVKRKAQELAKIATLMLQNCNELRLVDPYFDPKEVRWRDSLAAILSLIPDISAVKCEYHLFERDKSPSTDQLKVNLQKLNGVIPIGGNLRIIRWKEKNGGERFHRRYLLTENAGLNYEGGLDPEINAVQTTDVSLMDREHHHTRWAEYDLTSEIYDLVLPILIIDSNGTVSEANI